MLHILAGAAVYLADRIMKDSIYRTSPKLHKEIAGGHVIINRTENHGFAFNKLDDRPRTVKLITTIVGILAASYLSYAACGRGFRARLGAALITAGAAGNLTDRWKWGFVMDFITIPWKKLKRISFNIADLALLLGGLFSI